MNYLRSQLENKQEPVWDLTRKLEKLQMQVSLQNHCFFVWYLLLCSASC